MLVKAQSQFFGAAICFSFALNSCGVLNKKSSDDVQEVREVALDELMLFSAEDPGCGTSVNVTNPLVWRWDGTSASQIEVPAELTPGPDGELSSKGVLGSISNLSTESSCTVSDNSDLDCGEIRIKDEGKILKSCRPNGDYARESLEAVSLASQVLLSEAAAFYQTIPESKRSVSDSILLVQRLDIIHRTKGPLKKTLAISDNASFAKSAKSENSIFSVYPTAKKTFQESGVHLWEVPFVLSHEYGHNVFNAHLGHALKTVGVKIFRHESINGILSDRYTVPRDMFNLSESDRAERAFGGVNELFADLFAYYAGKGASGQLKGVHSLETTRDPSSAVTKAGVPKIFGPSELDIFEGRAEPIKKSNGDPEFDSIHDIAAALGYPIAKLLDDSTPGATNMDRIAVLIKSLNKLAAEVVSTRSSAKSLDEILAVIVRTISENKTVAAAESGKVCSDFQALVPGLERTAAACQ
jgi:hypothetical protein